MITNSAVTACGGDQSLAGFRKVAQQAILGSVVNHRPTGNVQVHVAALAAAGQAAAAGTTGLGRKALLVGEANQCVLTGTGPQDHVSAASSVTTGRAAVRNIFFAPQPSRARAAASGDYGNGRSVEKLSQ